MLSQYSIIFEFIFKLNNKLDTILQFIEFIMNIQHYLYDLESLDILFTRIYPAVFIILFIMFELEQSDSAFEF